MVVGDLVLCVASGYAICHCGRNQDLNWRLGTYGLCFVHGLLGVVNHFAESSDVEKVYDYTLTIVDIVPLPFVATQLYLDSSMDQYIAYIHAASGVLPLITDLMENNSSNVRDLVIIGNCASVAFLAIQQDKPWYFALVVMGALNHFYTRKAGQDMDVQPNQALSVGLGIFCLIVAFKT